MFILPGEHIQVARMFTLLYCFNVVMCEGRIEWSTNNIKGELTNPVDDLGGAGGEMIRPFDDIVAAFNGSFDKRVCRLKHATVWQKACCAQGNTSKKQGRGGCRFHERVRCLP